MADIAASVLARLKNKAAESGRSYQLCLQLFCQEEFLRRLEKLQIASPNGHLCHIRRTARDIISGQTGTH